MEGERRRIEGGKKKNDLARSQSHRFEFVQSQKIHTNE
jgi:hypothetical protein